MSVIARLSRSSAMLLSMMGTPLISRRALGVYSAFGYARKPRPPAGMTAWVSDGKTLFTPFFVAFVSPCSRPGQATPLRRPWLALTCLRA